MEACGIVHKPQEVKNMIDDIDAEGTGKIDYNQFKKIMNNMSRLQENFGIVDNLGVGFIDASQLQRAMEACGIVHKPQEVKNMIDDIDAEGTGKIDYNQFKKIMNNMPAQKAAAVTLSDPSDPSPSVSYV
mmetsp:Transcript_80637/g.118258  ORF Transcript_80637/g.118258 Transcript_80637/m.118258 type:complete len:130 (+) Transcript_80637:731-1120(+)